MTSNNEKMFLRFDNREHSFPAPNDAAPETNDLCALITSTQGENHGHRSSQGFNDLQRYMTLSADGKASIRSISVYHNQYCLGIKVTYSRNGRLGWRLDVACMNHFIPSSGYYTWHGGRQRESSLILAEDEYLCEVRSRQGDITDQVTFCTNKRTVTFGGMGGSADPRDVSNLPVDLTKRVVAFVGTFGNGALARIGTVSVLHNWEIIGDFVLLRELVERKRASPYPLRKLRQKKEDEAALQEVMNVDASIFRRVLSFLIANVETDQV